MAEPPTIGGLPCVFGYCDELNNTGECTCVWSNPFLPPPPPISAAANSSHTGVAPYVIATVCILGISFLLLTTCTIILRYRFSRRRTVSTARFNEPTGGGDHGGSVVDHPIWHIATVGLQQSVIDSITAFKYKKVDGLLIDGSNCSVCLTGFGDGDDLRLLPKCGHAFHLLCIDTWLRSHKNCPLCRAPVVNDDTGVGAGNFTVIQVRSGNLGSGQNDEMENLENNNGVSVSLGEGGGDGSQQLRERGDDFVELHTEGIKIAEILKRNRKLRILSDLGENYRFRGEDEDGLEPIRRSISYNSSASAAIYRTMSDVFPVGNDEGCSSNTDPLVQEKKTNVEKVPKWGSSMSGLLKSSSFGRSLQKGPISMKRSFSSGGKLFSFRRTKNQASILPL